MLLHHTFERTARDNPEKIALVYKDKRLTYQDLDRLATRLGAALQARGVERGDRVAIFLENSPEAVVSFYAALKIGAVFVPINPLTKRDKLLRILSDAEPAALIADSRLGVWDETACDNMKAVVLCGPPQALGPIGNRAHYDQIIGEIASLRNAGTIDQDLAAIIYTSGSTGDAKGVMLSHLNMVSAGRSIISYLGLQHDDVIVCALPLSFDYGLYQILMGFAVGARVVLEPAFVFPMKVLEAMVREHGTVFPGVPTMFSLLMNLDAVARYPLPHLRIITNTAAALSEQHIRRLIATFPQARLYSMYGLTECKRVSYLPPEELERRPTSVGRGMPNEEVYLVDEQGRRLPNGSTGQLVIRGSNVMRGYWRRPEETARKLKPGPLPGEWVLHSGDIFRTDEEGYLYFVARSDDIIKSRGEKVSPKEVENALYGIEGVMEAAVVGVPDPLLGQAIKAFVVLKEGYGYSEREIIRQCLARLENFMAPKRVVFVNVLPKTENGKIDKKRLQESDVACGDRAIARADAVAMVNQGA
jgi:long-chain acyl-CoA synthetase